MQHGSGQVRMVMQVTIFAKMGHRAVMESGGLMAETTNGIINLLGIRKITSLGLMI